MSSSSSKSSGCSMGFGSVLLVVFVVLKLTHLIDWSWWWVLSPIWIAAGLVVAILIFFAILATIKALI